ncbi:porin, partial [Aliarcobacter butzleri]|uniref:porin n=1 Tax=Aliarcobacter butzleri TaxID=28197 RepID=UPI003AF953F0
VVDAGVTATKIRHYEPASDSMERHARIGLDSGNLSASRIGIKGIENLGGGTEAIFNLEAGFNTDNGQGGDAYSSALFGRRAVVGLKNEH